MRILVLIILSISYSYCEVEFSARCRNFSIELLHHTQKQTDGHVVISPFGIWTLMTGLAVGATGNSFEEIQRAFILPRKLKTVISGYKNLTDAILSKSDGVSLTSKNFLFTDDDFKMNDDFKQIVTDDFDANIEVLHFKSPEEASAKANNFIQDSGARVSNVLSSADFNEARMLVTNVISFKGLWASPFNETETAVENFYNENKTVIGQVNMMYQKGLFAYSNVDDLKAFACELPYGTDEKFSMIIILPHPNARVEDTYKRLVDVTLPQIVEKLQNDTEEYGLDEIEIKLPRFKISSNVVMNKPLNDMGVYEIFEPAAASFQRITNESIYVSAIVHKADIEITETGTVASASTSAILVNKISAMRLIANRPFIYFIIEKSTTTVIFGGIYSKPAVY